MIAAQRFTLIVAVERFENPRYHPLPGAAKDGQRIAQYARDPDRGCYGNVHLLENPTRSELEWKLSDVLRQAKAVDGTVLIYFATHGLTDGRSGLALLPRDADPERLVATAISVTQLAHHVGEHPPRATIFVFDVCKAGGHTAGTAALALERQWADEIGNSLQIPDGHFIIGACGAHESAREDHVGGRFTSLLLATLDSVGQRAPHLDEIPIELLASEIVSAAKTHLPEQRPSWSGVAISNRVIFGKNPFHSRVPANPSHHADLRDLTSEERQQLSEPLRQHLGTLALIGGEKPWSALGLDVVEALRSSSATVDAKVTFLVRAAEAAGRRLPTPASATDLREFFLYLEGSIVAVARDGGPAKTLPLVEIAASLMTAVVSEAEQWTERRGWLIGLGPPAAGLAPVLFWEKLGLCSLVALACRAAGFESQACSVEGKVAKILNAHPLLHRVTWAGQYADIALVLGTVLRHDKQVARVCVTNLISRLLQDAKANIRPVEAEIRGADLGKQLARQLLSLDQAPNDTVEEAIPFFLLLLHLSGTSEIELNLEATKLRGVLPQRLWALYVPEDIASQFEHIMDRATVHSWVDHESTNALAKMLEFLVKNDHWPYDVCSPTLALEIISSAAAGRIFRNRSNFGLPGALVSCP